MDAFSIDDVSEHFRADIGGVLAAVAPRLAAIAAAEVRGAGEPRADLEAVDDACHTISGSAALVGATGLVAANAAIQRLVAGTRDALMDLDAAARRLRSLAEGAAAALPDLERLLDLELARRRGDADTLAAAIGARADRLLAGMPEPVPTPVEEEPGFDFADEPAVPRPAAPDDEGPLFALTEDDASPPGIDDIVREAFTQEAGELLDAMDRHALDLEHGAPAGPAIRELFRSWHTLKGSANTVGLTGIGAAAHRAEDELEGWDPAAIDVHAASTALLRVQRALRQALDGGAMPDPEWVAGELARARSPRTATTAIARPDTEIHVPAAADAHDPRRSLRVASDQLDRLMRMAGELVITRSRLSARLAGLGETQRELSASRGRLLATVDGFRARNEFAGLDGGRTRIAVRAGRGGRIEDLFSELELDRYEDIHVLSRSLSEITGDIGELQGQIQRAIGDIGEDAESLGRAVGEIQGEITRARMVPLEALFARLHLAVQDAAERGGMAVRVDLAGGTTALDKAIVDGIHGPLTHLVRNAVAHGIEAAEDRILAGKPPDGRIAIAAHQEGGQIVITVADDGQGLDLGKLRERGVRMGLLDPTTPLDAEAVIQLVFAPGLSTSERADEVSGRGFGCDVARAEIQRLGGTVTVASRAGAGTTFTVTLPLTLSISRALLVRAGEGRFAVPMNFVERIIDLEQAKVSLSGGVRRVAQGDEEIRLIDLAAALGLREDDGTALGAALVVRLGEQRWAVRVDGLLRQEDVVVSSLGELLSGHPLFAGVTFAGGAGLVPIVDLPGLLAPGVGAVPRRAAPVAPKPKALPAPGLRRVLFVDDSLSVRKVAELHLRALGVEPVLAVDGEDALAKLRQEPVAMVFTDLEMPRMHGYDLLRELRFIPAHKDLPVVVVTSRAGDKHRALADQLGANGYLTKPFTPEQLRDALARWVPA